MDFLALPLEDHCSIELHMLVRCKEAIVTNTGVFRK